MKICLKCGKKYDDSWGVCLQDNAPLSIYTGAEVPKAISQPQSSSVGFKEAFHFYHYMRLILIALIMPVGFLLTIGEFQKELKMKGNFFAALFSYSGILMMLIIIAFAAILGIIYKYRKNPTGKNHRTNE